ncbi:MAG: DUF692 family multinuclear iron-containing protein [Chitinophagales bacterium]
MQNKFLGFGLGLRNEHIPQIVKERPKTIDWFEIISENYFQIGTVGRQKVEDIRADYPFVMHGVSLSIGSTDPVDKAYLKQLKSLEKWLQPEVISDHICWTGIQQHHTHDLLPVPYTEESLKNMILKIQQVQDYLGRQIALENPSTYLEFEASQIPEWEFIRYVAEEANCKLLLDVNNVYVSCFNHGYDPYTYIDSLPAERIVQIHMAGHENHGTHLIDTHNQHLIPEVLDLYESTIQKIGLRNTMIEWDSDIPELNVLLGELQKVKDRAAQTLQKKEATPAIKTTHSPQTAKKDTALFDLYSTMQTAIYEPQNAPAAETWVKINEKLPVSERIFIYAYGYRRRLYDGLKEIFPITEKYLGEKGFNKLAQTIIEAHPSKHHDFGAYLYQFPDFAESIVEKVSYELLQLEVAISKIGALAEEEGVKLEVFQQLNPESLFALNVEMVTSCRLLSFQNNVYGIYKYFQIVENNPIEVEQYLNQTCWVLVQKEDYQVAHSPISKADYLFLNSLNQHDNFMGVLEECMTSHGLAIESLIPVLGKYIQEGVIKITS